MDLNIYDGKVTGLNGVVEHILSGVLADKRWVIDWVGSCDDEWNPATVVVRQPFCRVIRLEYRESSNNSDGAHGYITITITESESGE